MAGRKCHGRWHTRAAPVPTSKDLREGWWAINDQGSTGSYDPNTFVVRNSWGTELWGDKGFGYASNVYAAAAFTEAYGVNLV